MRKILPFLLVLSACANRPVDAVDICNGALQGVNDPQYETHSRCINEISVAAYTSAHNAAKPYRDMARP